jgi:hypothetical protein
MLTVSKKIPVLIGAIITLMVLSIPATGLPASCRSFKEGAFTFRIHPSSNGADTDINVKYCARLDQGGTVSLALTSVEADPWAYAKLESKIVTKDCSTHSVNLEIHTKVLLNEVWPDVVDGEIIPLYGPTQDIGEIQRVIPGFSWDAQTCPEIKSVLPETSPVIFEGHTIPEHSYATKVKDVQGDVRIKNEGSGRLERPVPGTEVKPGDTIETQQGEITFFMRAAKIKAGAQTLLKIAFEKTGLNLVHGFLFVYARKERDPLKIATPNAICGVRGTKYKIRHDQATNTSIVEVEDGVVAFYDPQNRKTVEVQAGMKSIITGNGLPSDPVPIQ